MLVYGIALQGPRTGMRANGNRAMGDNNSLPEVEIDYPLAFANAFAPTIEKPFRFIHCSGALIEKDQTKPLWFLEEGRRIKVNYSS